MKSIFIIIILFYTTTIVLGVSLPIIEETRNFELHQKEESLPDALKNFKFVSDKSDIGSHIVGGEEAIPHAYPYTVGLSIFTKLGSMVWCGASLIAEDYVITAAHCLHKARDIIVYLGCHRIDDKNCIKIKTEKVHIIIHEQFQSSSLQNDIALIKLPGSVRLSEKIQLIKLPERNQTVRTLENEDVTVTGWGYYHDGNPELSNFLRVINVRIMNQKACKIKYLGILRKTNICIDGSEGKSTCNGDSGGPLALTDKNNEKVLVGLSSFGAKAGCEIGWPAVFTRITSYLDWIMSRVA